MLASPTHETPTALIGIGQVRHKRLRPKGHAFAYATYFWMLPMRSLRLQPNPLLKRNRWASLNFTDRDHGDGRTDSLAWLDELLQGEGVTDAQGEIWLQCYPRVLGHAFKPVSFWYCHRPDGALSAIVVEVNNTFGERHCYLLQEPDMHWGQQLQIRKIFHVSPFCKVQGHYAFRFMRTADRIVACIDHHDAEGLLIQTSISGVLHPLAARRLRSVFWGMPLMSWGIVARIHLQALKLWFKRTPYLAKPTPPEQFLTRSERF
jgi:uncharacterized protein